MTLAMRKKSTGAILDNHVDLPRVNAKKTFFYGYVLVVTGSLMSFLLVGTHVTFGIFFKPMSTELGWARATTATAMSLANLMMGFFAMVSGRLTDRFGPRVVLTGCGVIFGLGYLLMSRINAFWQLYIFFGLLIGMSMSAADVPLMSTLVRWFARKRGAMIGITKAGAGVGMLFIPLLANWLISSYGWRNAYVTIGFIGLVGVVSLALFFRRDPAQTGDLPDGDTVVNEKAERVGGEQQCTLREAMGTRRFWIFTAIWFGFFFNSQVVIVHLAPHITDIGIKASTAAAVVSVVGGFSIAGRLGLGTLSDKIGILRSLFIAASFGAAGMALVLVSRQPWMFYLFASLYGVAHGAYFALLSPTIALLFGLRSLGVIMGAAFFLGNLGGVISPILAGRVFDVTRSYTPVFLLCLALSLTSLVLLAVLKPAGNQPHRRSI